MLETIALRSFGPTSTTEDVLEGIDLSGKRALVTGVSAGIGVETARALVAHGAQVVGAVRQICEGGIGCRAHLRRRGESGVLNSSNSILRRS